MKGHPKSKKKAYPSKKRSTKLKYRLKKREKRQLEEENQAHRDESIETCSSISNSMESGSSEEAHSSDLINDEYHDITNLQGSQMSTSTSSSSFDTKYREKRGKKGLPYRRRSKKFKYRQKTFAAEIQRESNDDTALYNEPVDSMEAEQVQNNISDSRSSSDVQNSNNELQLDETATKEIQQDCEIDHNNNDTVSDGDLGKQLPSGRNQPIILDKIKNEPVKILLDVPCNDKLDAVAEQFLQEKRNRYIIDAVHFYQEIVQLYNDHKKVESSCHINHWKLKQNKIRPYGLTTRFTFECQNCFHEEFVFSEAYEEHTMDINTAMVAATLSTGIGLTQIEQIFAGMAVHCMTDKMYIEKQSGICQDIFAKATEKSMREAAEEERKLAIERGDVTKEGIPYITVIIDGSWLKRTYGTHWNSCAGTAVIIGARTGKVLFFDVRNKYCLVCARAYNRGVDPKEHKCEKNWAYDQASTGMESNIILQGFKESMERYNIIYGTVVMDNDSNLYKTIVDSNVYLQYGVVRKRILCSVHLSKNVCKNLRKAAESTQTVNKGQRGIGVVRNLIRSKVETCRLKLKEVISSRIQQQGEFKHKVELLKRDILNILNAVFGDCRVTVLRCGKKIEKRKNVIPLIKSFGLFDKIEKIFKDLSFHSDSLLHNQSTNAAELINALICRALGGKRINWGLRSQYKTRVTTQVLQFNSNKCLSKFHEENGKIVPNMLIKNENKRFSKMMETRNRRVRYGKVTGGRKRPSFGDKSSKKYYGKQHEDVDMSNEDFQKEVDSRIQELKNNQKNRIEIEQETTDRNEHQWMSLEKKMLLSMNFGSACSWKMSTNCAAKVKKMLYPSTNLSDEARQYCIDQEQKVKEIIEDELDLEVDTCGLIIDEKYEFLGASPTAFVGNDGILLVVCSHKAQNLSVKVAATTDPVVKKLFIKGDLKRLNKKSDVYFEIQGCLHITKRTVCYLVLKTREDHEIITINVDDDFWSTCMQKQLETFFHKCLLPEMIDSRHNRRMPIRNPPETSKILEEKEKKKESKKSSALSEKKTTKRKFEDLCESNEDCLYVGSYKLKKKRSDISNEWFRLFANDRVISYHHVRTILSTQYKWLDDDVLDRLIYIMNQSNNPFETQSVMYIERPESVEPVQKSSIQIIGGNCINHWRTAYFDKDANKIFIYDSLPSLTGSKLSRPEKEYLSARFGFQVRPRDVTFPKMNTKQLDGSSCGLYAAAFAVTLFFGEDPSTVHYSTIAMQLRRHFLKIITSHEITRFPTK